MPEPEISTQAASTDMLTVSGWQMAYAGSTLAVEALAKDVLRIALMPDGAPPHRTWSVLEQPDDIASGGRLSVRESSAEVSLSTDALELVVSRVASRFRVRRPDGSVILDWAELAPDDTGAGIRWASSLAQGARIFGGGERTGTQDRRGRSLTFWSTDALPNFDDTTDAMYQCIPFLTTLVEGRAHGIFYDSAACAIADVGATETDELGYVTAASDLVVYLFAGPTLRDVLRQYTSVSGRMPPLPRWTLGNQQSRWSYRSADEVLEIAARFRAERIPCDAIHLDIDYMRGYRDFTWDAERFPDPAGLIRAVAEQDYHVVTIIDPGIKVDPDYTVYQEAAQRSYFIRTPGSEIFEGWVWPGLSAWVDFAQEEVVVWWGEQHRALLDAGVAGIWIDMNEPTQAGMWAPRDVQIPHGTSLPLDSVHGTPDDPLSHADFHNAYAIEMARATYEGLRRLAPEQRAFVLTRGAGAGAQRFTAVWNGDTTSSWEHLRMAVPLNLGISLSGFPMTGGDIGGFWQDTTPELLVRWTQMGALLPFCRNHSAIGTIRQEPWAFGEPFTSLCREAIERRYRLLPYLVTLAHEAASDGSPIMRPLAWLAPNDPASVARDDEFLLGNDLLVAPVLTQGATERSVILPPGDWFAWNTDELYSGGQMASVPVELETTPIFVRSGAIVPLAGVTQSTQEVSTEPLQVQVYLSEAGQTATATLWDDDDHPDAEQRGSYAQYELSAQWEADSTLTVTMTRVGGHLAFRYPGVQIDLHLPSGYIAAPDTATAASTSTSSGDTFVRRFSVKSPSSD